MPKCDNCGEPISEEQYYGYNGLCSACKRISGVSTKQSGKDLFGWGIFITLMGAWIAIGMPLMFSGMPGADSGFGISLNTGLIIAGTIAMAIGALMIYFGRKKMKEF